MSDFIYRFLIIPLFTINTISFKCTVILPQCFHNQESDLHILVNHSALLF